MHPVQYGVVVRNNIKGCVMSKKKAIFAKVMFLTLDGIDSEGNDGYKLKYGFSVGYPRFTLEKPNPTGAPYNEVAIYIGMQVMFINTIVDLLEDAVSEGAIKDAVNGSLYLTTLHNTDKGKDGEMFTTDIFLRQDADGVYSLRLEVKGISVDFRLMFDSNWIEFKDKPGAILTGDRILSAKYTEIYARSLRDVTANFLALQSFDQADKKDRRE